MVLPHWYAYVARIFFSKGDLEAMDQALLQAEQLNEQMHDPARLGSYITAERVRLWIARGELDTANHWEQTYLQQEDDPSQIARVLKNIALLRVRIANAEYNEALKQLKQLLSQARSAGRGAHVVELLVLQALVYQAMHEETAACESLERAFCLARPEGAIRVFADEGTPLAKLLVKLKQEKHKQDTFIDTLLAACVQSCDPRWRSPPPGT